MVHYLQEHGVDIQYNTKVVNVELTSGTAASGSRIVLQRDGREDAIDLTDNDLVFITNGGCVDELRLTAARMTRVRHTMNHPEAGYMVRKTTQIRLWPS